MSLKPTLEDMLPDRIPPRWKETAPFHALRHLPSKAWEVKPLLVALSLEDYDDHGLWLHASISAGGRRLPTWEEVVTVKRVLFEDRPVIQILPPQSEWVNLYECLHLWERIDQPTVPEAVWRVRRLG